MRIDLFFIIFKRFFYSIQLEINPEFKVAEQTFDNNAAVCELIYSEQSIWLGNCRLTRPGQAPSLAPSSEVSEQRKNIKSNFIVSTRSFMLNNQSSEVDRHNLTEDANLTTVIMSTDGSDVVATEATALVSTDDGFFPTSATQTTTQKKEEKQQNLTKEEAWTSPSTPSIQEVQTTQEETPKFADDSYDYLLSFFKSYPNETILSNEI